MTRTINQRIQVYNLFWCPNSFRLFFTATSTKAAWGDPRLQICLCVHVSWQQSANHRKRYLLVFPSTCRLGKTGLVSKTGLKKKSHSESKVSLSFLKQTKWIRKQKIKGGGGSAPQDEKKTLITSSLLTFPYSKARLERKGSNR